MQISLAAARKNAKLTQDEAAKELKVAKQTLLNWERGYTEPAVSQFRAACKLYGVTMNDIFIPEKSNEV